MVSDRTHDDSRVMVTTLKSGAVYSPTADSARKIGRKAAAVVSDEVRSGTWSSRAESTAAFTGGRPSPICTMIDSDITIALSTSMPRAMISEAIDIWSRPIEKNDIISSVVSIAIGISVATTRPVLRPRNSSITRVTMPIAW